ncbi:MAG: hypothetical protein RMK91_03430 [Pseudanabaenaceae cyanobacterium SKYGB_i_bin29]|nr:hypothetical protein [Pseudanabaenaceae cyanobacterium SKYG29]MDW8420896.1 hypothetical protein [Pseudanabaenaceae cyanobacterium SKYGB_i_bin29]
MARPILRLKAKIEALHFRGQLSNLVEYDWDNFHINIAKPACKIRFSSGAEIALSKWRGPKRTRTYPLAKVYNTYSHSGKTITVIPIIKDEGGDTNLDRINYTTLSWMNSMNIYIILAWYSEAKEKDGKRLTNQKLEVSHVRKKLNKFSVARWMPAVGIDNTLGGISSLFTIEP